MDYKNNFLRFYECCMPVKGWNRAAVYDLQRSQVFFVPNELVEIVEDNKEKKLETIYEENDFQLDLLKKQLSYLHQNELTFYIENPENFPEVSKEIIKPNLLEFIYLNIDSIDDKKRDFLKTIDVTGVNNLVLTSNGSVKKDTLKTLLDTLKISKVKCINILAEYSKDDFEEIKDLIREDARVRRSVFYNCNENIKEEFEHIFFTNRKLEKVLTGGILSPNNLTINLEAYLEGLHKNLYYNQKIFIEDNGDIVRFFNDTSVLGNIYEDDICKIIKENELLKEFWNISKDKIQQCKICEFRYVCPDNRIPKKVKDTYVYESPCHYNPKTNQWIEV